MLTKQPTVHVRLDQLSTYGRKVLTYFLKKGVELMEKKEDRRVTMTRRMLKEALTELLRETDIYHVSIRESPDRHGE